MLKINCKGCKSDCCKHPLLTPVLLPSEEKKFKKIARKINTKYGEIFVLKKRKDNSCVLLKKDMKCRSYEKRPLDCIIYPFLLDFKRHSVSIKLDKRYCPNLKTLTFNKKLISKLKKQKFPPNWIKKYKTLVNF